jgi:hypothetical protein
VIESVMAEVNEAGCVGEWIGGMKWEMMAEPWRMCDVHTLCGIEGCLSVVHSFHLFFCYYTSSIYI